MTDDRTSALDLPLPHPTNDLSDDVLRLRTALIGLDTAVAARASASALLQLADDTDQALADKADAEAVDLALGDKLGVWSHTTTAANKTLANRERCSVTAAGRTITLPPDPAPGWEVVVAVGDFDDTVIARNAQTIRGQTDDARINRAHATVHLYFDGSTWRDH